MKKSITSQGGAQNDYLKALEARSKESKVYKDFQLIGLEIADLLHDRAHKALYIKMAKEYGASKMMALAKDVSQRQNVDNKGAYFMTLVKHIKDDTLASGNPDNRK